MPIYTITHFRRRDGLGRRTQQSTLLETLEAAIKAEMLDANCALSDEDIFWQERAIQMHKPSIRSVKWPLC